MKFFRTMTKKTKEKIMDFFELFSDRLAAEIDDYQNDLTKKAGKIHKKSPYHQSKAQLLDDGSVAETEISDKEIDLGKKFASAPMEGVEVIDKRKDRSYKRTMIFLHYLMKASTTEEFDAIAECFPDMVGDQEFGSYIGLCRSEIDFYDKVQNASTVEELRALELKRLEDKRLEDDSLDIMDKDVAAYFRLREYEIRGVKPHQPA